MKTRKKVLIGFFILLNILFGLRGLWKENRNFFTMHPFSDPIVTCSITAFDRENPVPLPPVTYHRLSTPIFTNRTYLEVIPLYEQGLTKIPVDSPDRYSFSYPPRILPSRHSLYPHDDQYLAPRPLPRGTSVHEKY